MTRVRWIFDHPGLRIAVGEAHTNGEPQVRIEVKGEAVRLPAAVARQMAEEIRYWIDETSQQTRVGEEGATEK